LLRVISISSSVNGAAVNLPAANLLARSSPALAVLCVAALGSHGGAIRSLLLHAPKRWPTGREAQV
jgi:hypothetical protein